MIETEVKIRLDEKKYTEIFGLLKMPKKFLQENLIFENEDYFFRIRLELGKNLFTIKSKKRNGNSRQEIESELSEDIFDEVKKLDNVFHYKKERINCGFFECAVSLDVLENGMKFVEIEGDESAIKECLRVFGLDGFEIETRSYLEVLKEARNGLH